MDKGLPVKMLGPYTFSMGPSKGRKYVKVYYLDGTEGTTLYSRYLMEQRAGRRLDPNLETVDHINRDKTDDRIENLQVLTRSEHGSKDARGSKPVVTARYCCCVCETMFTRDVSKQKGSPCCSKICVASLAGSHDNHAKGESNGRSKLTESDVKVIKSLPDVGTTKLGKRFGVDPGVIRAIRQGKTWTHVI